MALPDGGERNSPARKCRTPRLVLQAGCGWLVAGLTVFILASVLAGAYWRFSAPGPPTGPPVPLLRPFALTVAPGIHMLGGLDPAAAYVVESSEGLI